MDSMRHRIERPVRAQVPPRDLKLAQAILLRGLAITSLPICFGLICKLFAYTIAQKCSCCREKIGAFPHLYHIDGLPCQTHVWESTAHFFGFPFYCWLSSFVGAWNCFGSVVQKNMIDSGARFAAQMPIRKLVSTVTLFPLSNTVFILRRMCGWFFIFIYFYLNSTNFVNESVVCTLTFEHSLMYLAKEALASVYMKLC